MILEHRIATVEEPPPLRKCTSALAAGRGSEIDPAGDRERGSRHCFGLRADNILSKFRQLPNVPVDKTWLRETLQPLLATLAIFMMVVWGTVHARHPWQG
jgi:hypothetical protein